MEKHVEFQKEYLTMDVNLSASPLTDYEKRIVQLMCEARPDHDISAAMNMSLDEISDNKRIIFEKTQTGNWAELVIYAIQNEIFQLRF